jgi:hypothetical protein
MKASTRALMRSLKHTSADSERFGISRRERAKQLRLMRSWRGGRESLRDTHLFHFRPCPACGRKYDVGVIRPPYVPVGARCACCCQ